VTHVEEAAAGLPDHREGFDEQVVEERSPSFSLNLMVLAVRSISESGWM
jgi:hypothetical protein